MVVEATGAWVEASLGRSRARPDGGPTSGQDHRHHHEDVDTQPAVRSGVGVSIHEPADRADRSGQLVADRYRVLRLLGRGGMGAVWLALDTVLTRPVALKEPGRADRNHDPDPDSTALREARAACAVSHPGVVQVYDLVVHDGRPWIVMEALSGTTLAQVIRQEGPLPAERVVDLALRLLEALGSMHREGIIHGDIKPSNVQLVGTGRAVLTDFGLASRLSEAEATTDAGHVVGSPPYMAPEVIRGGGRSPASDLFSLGATLYEAAEGRRPFDDATPAATALAVLLHSPEPACPGTALGSVIDGLLLKDPVRRWSATEACARLTEIESGATWPRTGASLEPAYAC